MNKEISLSVPATIYDFGETKNLTANKYLTQAKLKIFYVGKTSDLRVFNQSFSDQLLTTLPGTPVVAYYNEDKEDFVGHNIVQHVFGYVPENATIEYLDEEVDGKNTRYAVTDVLLFTGRGDNIGTIAQKIIGHPHSLELDPKTVDYTVTKVGGKMKSVEFTKGHFIGLSVLGVNEKPAFAGSSFFQEGSEVDSFLNSFIEFKESVEFLKSGGQEMNQENEILAPTNYQSFMSASLLEEIEKITKLLNDDGIYGYFIDKVDSYYVFRVYLYEDGDSKAEFRRITIVDNAITSMETVFLRYVTSNEADSFTEITEPVETVIDEPINSSMSEAATQEVVEDDEDKKDKEDMTEASAIADTVTETVVETEMTETNSLDNEVANAEVIEGTENDGAKTEEDESGTQVTNATALNDAERQELNEYRKEAKFSIIENYSELSEDIKNKYRDSHANFSLEDLDKELAFELVKSQRQVKNREMKIFTTSTKVEVKSENTINDLIAKYKD